FTLPGNQRDEGIRRDLAVEYPARSCRRARPREEDGAHDVPGVPRRRSCRHRGAVVPDGFLRSGGDVARDATGNGGNVTTRVLPYVSADTYATRTPRPSRTNLLTKPLIFMLLCSYLALVVFPLLWLLYSSFKADR